MNTTDGTLRVEGQAGDMLLSVDVCLRITVGLLLHNPVKHAHAMAMHMAAHMPTVKRVH